MDSYGLYVEVFGLAIDEKGNKTYGGIKIEFGVSENCDKINDDIYSKLVLKPHLVADLLLRFEMIAFPLKDIRILHKSEYIDKYERI